MSKIWIWGAWLFEKLSLLTEHRKTNLFTLYFDKAINGEHIEVDNELAISPDLAEWFSLDFYPVYNSSSNLLGVFFSARNINNRVRDKEKIIETNTKLKAIIDNTADNYILFDANLNIILANKNANTASGGILPMCQDTGTAIVLAKKGVKDE